MTGRAHGRAAARLACAAVVAALGACDTADGATRPREVGQRARGDFAVAPAPGPERTPPSRYLLVHGGWEGAWTWYKVIARLEQRGHDVTAVELPSHGIDGTDPASVDMAAYVAAVTAALDADDEPAILVGHSLGGMVITAAAEARPDAVAKLVYLAAFLPESGQNLTDLANDGDSLIGPALKFGVGVVDLDRDMVDAALYGTTGADDRALAHLLLKITPAEPFRAEVTWTEANFGRVPRYYITTLQDRAIPPASQAAMIAAVPVAEVFEVDSDHSAFFSQADAVVAHLEAVARR
jgi:pimeloyl-ACP methyl ester carboxylesterase